MIATIKAETTKLSRSKVGVVTAGAVVLGTTGLLSGITAGISAGNTELIAKAGPAATLSWTGLLAGAMQITSVAAILGSGAVTSWVFGREFSDRTIAGLLSLPMSRSHLAAAKLAVCLSWAVLVNTALTVCLFALGLAIGYGTPTSDTWADFGRLWALGVLSAGLSLPVAWVATHARSILAAFGSAIALVVITQIGVLAGTGGWMPLATPSLWATTSGTGTTTMQMVTSILVACAFAATTCLTWNRIELES